MNPLTQIKNTQKISRAEVAAGYTDSQSWHARFKHSAYIFTGGLPFKLTDGDLLAIFSQYGEIIDVNLVRHKETGNPRGFAFLAYEDQRSTNLAVDNLNGMKVGGRMITVDHVDNYKRKRAEAEGREESGSEDEDSEADGDAEAAVALAAAGDGAQVISAEDAVVQSQGREEDAPWAAKSSVHALLNSDLPIKPSMQTADEEEDPMLAMMKQKKAKKEKKKKNKKEKHKKRALGKDSSDEAMPPRKSAQIEGLQRPLGIESERRAEPHEEHRRVRRQELDGRASAYHRSNANPQRRQRDRSPERQRHSGSHARYRERDRASDYRDRYDRHERIRE